MKYLLPLSTPLLVLANTSTTTAEEKAANWMVKAGHGVMIHYEIFGAERLTPEEYNQRVNSFKVDSFVEQLRESGAGYLILTLGQNSGYYCSPNKTYDKLLGVEPGRKTATRDLPMEIGKALKKENIRLILYLPSRAPQKDRKAMEALGDTDQMKPTTQTFIKNWSDICREWSLRYGKLVSGWWFDGYYVPKGWANLDAKYNWKTWAEACRAGNPKAELAFNRGVHGRVAFMRLNDAQTYIAGESNRFGPTPRSHPAPGKMTWQLLTFLGPTWGKGRRPRIKAERLVPYVKTIKEQGGCITFDIPVSAEGKIPDLFMRLLRQLRSET